MKSLTHIDMKINSQSNKYWNKKDKKNKSCIALQHKVYFLWFTAATCNRVVDLEPWFQYDVPHSSTKYKCNIQS